MSNFHEITLRAFCLIASVAGVGCGGATEPEPAPAPEPPEGEVEVAKQGFQDPTFQDPEAWTATGGALVDPQAEGHDSPGAGVFSPTAICKNSALSQTVQWPPSSPKKTAKVTIWAKRTPLELDLTQSLGMHVGGIWQWVGSITEDWSETSVCLGEAGTGRPVSMGFGPFLQPSACSGSASDIPAVQIDDVSITNTTPEECTPPGTVRNGDFASDAGWALVKDGTGSTAEISDGELTLEIAAPDGVAQATGQLSVPTSRTQRGSALQLTYFGTLDDRMRILLEPGSFPVSSIPGTGSTVTTKICMPLWAQGGTYPLVVRFAGLDAGGIAPHRFVLDDFELVGTAACPDTYIIDGGFEFVTLPDFASQWTLGRSGDATVTNLDDPSEARSGAGSMRMQIKSTCTSASATTTVEAPPTSSMPGWGPAVSVWYRYPSAQGTTASIVTLEGSTELPAVSGYTEQTVCLNGLAPGRPQAVELRLQASGGACDTNIDPEAVWFDDVTVNISALCPPD